MDNLKAIPRVICNEDKTVYVVEIHFTKRTNHVQFIEAFEQLINYDYEFIEDGLIMNDDDDSDETLH